MEQWVLDIFKTSPVLGAFLVFWYYQRKDYIKLVENTQTENLKREEKYQSTIEKLTDNLKTVDNVQIDVKEIKEYIFKK